MGYFRLIMRALVLRTDTQQEKDIHPVNHIYI